MNRAMAVARMQLINKWTFLGIPAVIIGGSFLLSLVIFALIPNSVGVKYSGAGQAVMWYFFGLGIQSLTLSFPFSQGLSVSRRNFFLGTVGLFTVLAAAISALYVILGIVETATNGWGLQGRMFAISWVADRSWFVQWFFYFVLMMFLFLLGFWAATVYKRWQATGVLVMTLSFAVLVVAAVALITWQGWWPAVGAWLITLTPLSLGALAFAFVLILGFAAFSTLRRATP
ncbi:hypothetical protein [Arthrobacter sp.]|uniref:hypothetical protein n=1 Tax=Arthrobacter sp. TaxID=1667 RepID=UPI0026DEAD30|nr:hypothetical protein [Arthrobacter sp.]MDO5751871.1 hypothetical protein [Arthrobacter sp.]